MKRHPLAAVGVLAVSIALVLGLATPASARPAVAFPTCATVVPASTLTAFGVRSVMTTAFDYGASAPTLTSIIATNRDRTCTFARESFRSVLSEVEISAADYTVIRDWYLSHGYAARAAGTATTPGSPTDIVFTKTNPKNGAGEMAFLSRDGWWITVNDTSVGTIGSFTYDAVERFLSLNPHL